MQKLAIAGWSGGTHLGDSFASAARELNQEPVFLNIQSAFDAPKLVRIAFRRLLGRRAPRMKAFGAEAVRRCEETGARRLLATGIAPLDAATLDLLARRGVSTICYLTDDPWNPAHKARWFLEALPRYRNIFSPRKSVIPDLQKAGCRSVHYLPFGYDPAHFYPEHAGRPHIADVIFAGGGDRDRAPYVEALIDQGFRIALFGDYWDRRPKTRPHSRGLAAPAVIRRVLAESKIALCLVRRANRDGNCMRTFEIPAAGACMLTEDTAEHREIFGEDGSAVVYFSDIGQMIAKARRLLADDAERKRLAEAAHRLITSGRNTYKDRLASMLEVTDDGR